MLDSLPWRPAVVFGGEELFFDIPMMPWSYSGGGVGGSATAASGAKAAYAIREDRIVRLTLRFWEWEFPLVEEWMEFARRAREFTFRFDQDDPSTEFTVFLEEPAWPDPWEPDRDEEFEHALSLLVAIRRVDLQPFGVAWSDALKAES